MANTRLVRLQFSINVAPARSEVILDPGQPHIPAHYYTYLETVMTEVPTSVNKQPLPLEWREPNPLVPGDSGSWEWSPPPGGSNLPIGAGITGSAVVRRTRTKTVFVPEQPFRPPVIRQASPAVFDVYPAAGWSAAASSKLFYIGPIEYSFTVLRPPAGILTGLAPFRHRETPLALLDKSMLNYAFMVESGGWRIVERGKAITPLQPYALSSIFTIVRVGNRVIYKVNNIKVYESRNFCTFNTCLVEGLAYSQNDEIFGAVVVPSQELENTIQGISKKSWGFAVSGIDNYIIGRSQRSTGELTQEQQIIVSGVSPRSQGKAWVGLNPGESRADVYGFSKRPVGKVTVDDLVPSQFITVFGMSKPTFGYAFASVTSEASVSGASRKSTGKAWSGFDGNVVDVWGVFRKSVGYATRYSKIQNLLDAPVKISIFTTEPVIPAPLVIEIEPEAELPPAPIVISIIDETKYPAPIRIQIFNDEQIKTSTSLPSTAGNQDSFWDVRVILDGVDVTASLVADSVEIVKEENAATIAELNLILFDYLGNPLTWVSSKPIFIDYKPPGSTEWFRLFTGVVDTVEVELLTNITRLTCTDGLQLMFEGQPIDGVKQVVGGIWSPFVFSDSSRGWDAFNDLMSTQLASFNLDATGKGVKTEWIAKEIPDFIFNEDAIFDGTADITLAHARDIVNSVDVRFDYQFTRLYEYRMYLGWLMPTVRFLLYGKIPDHHAIIDAINGADYAFHAFRRGPLTNVYNPICVPTLASQGNEDGSSASLPMLIYEPKKYLDKYQWDITGMNFTPVVGDALIDGINYVGDIPRFSQVSAFDAWVIKRFQQPITESYFTTISCPSSIRTAGKNHRSYNHAVQADYTGDRITNQWTETVQETIDYEVSKFGQAIVGGYGNSFIGNTCLESVNITVNRYAVGYPFEPPDQNVLSFSGSYKPLHWDRDKNPIDGRSKMQEAYEAVHSRVIKEIVASHRGSAVTFDTPLHPPVELSSTVQLRLGYDVNENIPKFNAKGKATRIVHRLNLQSGEATTSVTFALIKNLSTGIQFTAPQVDVPAQLQWGQCPHLPRIYTLSSWPPRVEDLWPGSNFVTPRPSTFRGWDFMTGEMIIESPNLPPEANFSAVKIISNAIKFEPPDDLLEMEQIP